MAASAPKAWEQAQVRDSAELADRARLMMVLLFIEEKVADALGERLRPKVKRAFVNAWTAYKKSVKMRTI